MAIVKLPFRNSVITDENEIRSFLARNNVEYGRWDTERVPVEIRNKGLLSAEEKASVLERYRSELEHLKDTRGYIKADVVALSAEIPNLDDLLKPFTREHYHTEDEVRFILDGRGVFSIRSSEDEYFEIEVSEGDFISVPAYAWHWFDLCAERRIKAIRLFQNESGWTPYYRTEQAGKTGG